MKITILSGGSGNDSLIKGLKSIYKNVDVKVVVNAYDNGLSTGVCRSITDTLGVSDIRKNHIRMYKAMNQEDQLDTRLIEFYENRYDLEPNCEASALDLLDGWGLKDKFGIYVHNFFKRIEYSDEHKFNNFNVANIVFSEMYSELGYEKTNEISCDLLGIDDFVILNSFQNVYLNAITSDYKVINDEGDIVKLCSNDCKIVNTFYTPTPHPELNPNAIDAVINCDLLLISTGTFWSSIYPTLQYGEFYKYINESKAKKKIWAINNNEDKDAFGVSSNDFINIILNLGLDLSSFIILENLDAIPSLQEDNQDYNIIKEHLGNTNGKHTPASFATALLMIYYNLTRKYDHILFDFDDTLYSRSVDKKSYSYSNLNLLKELKELVDVEIVSGNTYKSIEDKLIPVYGLNTSTYPKIWADANSCLYKDGEIVKYIDTHRIVEYRKVLDILENYEELNNKIHEVAGLDLSGYYLFNIKIKPLTSLERKLLCNILNSSGLGDAIAIPTGKTTVDILSSNNSKANVLKGLDGKVLYIGDEVDKGNDKDIAYACDAYVKVEDVEETNTLLQLLIKKLVADHEDNSRGE